MSTERGALLYQTGRYDLAAQEYRAALGEDPGNSLAHAMLGLCLVRVKNYEDATNETREAIRLRPDWHLPYAVLAEVMIERERPKEAAAAISQALALDPFNPAYHGLQSSIFLMLRQWKNALAAADQGLAIAPDSMHCLNTRAQALTMLGRRDEVSATIQGALQKDPENARTHASQGWALLHSGDHRQALVHFREALRLNPELDWAKAGLIEALKARNIVYRLMLRYFLFMNRLGRSAQWGIIIGGYIGYQIMQSIVQGYPSSAIVLRPLMLAYFCFVLMTWLAQPLFNLWMRIDRFGRYALSSDQRRGGELVGILLIVPIACCIAGLRTGNAAYLIAAILFLPVLATSSAIFNSAAGWPRLVMTVYSAALIAIFFVWSAASIPLFGLPDSLGSVHGSLFTAYVGGIFASGWIANGLMMARVRK